MNSEEKRTCWFRVAKNVSYVVAPIVLAVLIFMIVCMSYPMEREAINNKQSFFETETFAEDYSYEVFAGLSTVTSWQKNKDDIHPYSYYLRTEQKVEDNENVETIYYFTDIYGTNVQWLIIDNSTKEAFTNLSYSISNSMLDNILSQITQKGIYWNYDGEKVDTSIDRLNNVSYVDSRLQEETENANNYTIYSSLLDTLEYTDQIYQDQLFYNVLLKITPNAVYVIPVLVLILVALIPVCVVGIGRKKGRKEIVLNWFDKILIELAALIAIIIGCIGAIFIAVVGNTTTTVSFIVGLSSALVGAIIIYLACILFFETVVKRLKTHTFWKTTIAYWIYDKLKGFMENMQATKNFIIYFALYLMANLLSIGIMLVQFFVGLALVLFINIFVYDYISKRIKSYTKIKAAINDLYNGKTDLHLNEREFYGEDKEIAKHINDIAGGLSNAIDERLKSERLKTELITNVSHDIKTPLTSIINYIDLLKKENIEGEKTNEYLNILDSKSQRLKKLTEDLVEASKASSGSIKLNMEKLNVNELIKQVSGEFEDKFKAHNLQEIITLPEKEVYVKADSRYMYRVLENMYSNISKYAMEGTRVYVDIAEKNNKVSIQLKNVSNQKLNISADELMQRFVRGEASRNTEGSGLGLSIARSLTELQKGQFNIYLDGDLFKVTIEFEKEL